MDALNIAQTVSNSPDESLEQIAQCLTDENGLNAKAATDLRNMIRDGQFSGLIFANQDGLTRVATDMRQPKTCWVLYES